MSDAPDPGSMADDDIEDGAAYEGAPHVSPPPRVREYDGWHHPRKQVVRHAQWASPLNNILDARVDPVTHVKYLGLPGRDMLDIRHFLNTVCEPRGAKLEFLGFDRAAHADDEDNALLNSAYADVLRSPFTEGGVVRKDDIHRISVMGSTSYLAAKRLAPFDVINLDFCEPVILGSDQMYSLLDRLLRLQRTNDDWLLLLTSRVDIETAGNERLQLLLDLLEDDAESCEGLEETLADLLNLSRPLSAGQAKALSPTDFFVLTSMLAGTWLLREASKRGLQVAVVNACGYSVYPEPPVMDMLSLSIRLQPDHTSDGDAAGLVEADEKDHCAAIDSTLQRLRSIENVDTYMTGEVRDRFVRESIELIKSSNHPIEPYLQFLRDKGIDADS